MHAERFILETDSEGRLPPLPLLPPHARVEAILILLPSVRSEGMRRPPSRLSDVTRILGDIVAPAAEETEWEALG